MVVQEQHRQYSDTQLPLPVAVVDVQNLIMVQVDQVWVVLVQQLQAVQELFTQVPVAVELNLMVVSFQVQAVQAVLLFAMQ
jgi:hypothetical protein